MNLQLVTIGDKGQSNKERVHVTALADINLAYYVAFASRWAPDNTIYRVPTHAFWFPSVIAKSGDHIVLYTCAGKDTSEPRPDGKTNHFFYWGLPTVLFNDPGVSLTIFEALSWATFARSA